jgi:hypothetical protein
MAGWEFDEYPGRLVEQEPTERDQFNNDEVELAEALVREVIQNSTDAPAGAGPVKVRFAIREFDAALLPHLRGYFDRLRPHLAACGIDASALDRPAGRILVIEDFGTRGLTGDPAGLDDGNFHNFWRRHGKSVKSGRSAGRWGLGKTVFSSSSEIQTFFGLTVCAADAAPLLMGQAFLANHKIDGKRYPAHGFWFEGSGPEPDRLQLPVTDAHTIETFRRLVGITRTTQPGLSLVIPYLNPGITKETIIGGVVRNYFFPILRGRLVVEVGNVTIDRSTFHTVAAGVTSGTGGSAGVNIPLRFVEEVAASLDSAPVVTATGAIDGGGLAETMFSQTDRESMKASFASGGLLHVRVPVTLKRKSGVDTPSQIDLFLKSLPEGAKPFALFSRGSITVPGEMRYFGGAHAFGAMVASDDGIVEFLGDAENPAHTGWNASAGKLLKSWRAPSETLRHIRHALRELYDLVVDRVQHEDRDALMDFFALADQTRSVAGPKKRTPTKMPELPVREKAISIHSRNGGFTVVPGPAAAKWQFPKIVDVRVAYDIIGGNGFSRHSRFDFDLTEGDDIAIEAQNAEVTPLRPNKLRLKVTSQDFRLTASGFDVNRDLIVDARTV